ncbi:MAG TPA: hypothetical protein VFZ66_13190 [Herpetosiphonaceae bacterium]
MTEPISSLLWTQPGWLAQMRAWILAELERRHILVHGPIEQPHVRPWSTVLRVPTSAGDLYGKAVMPALSHEAALTGALARWRPDCMVQPVAIDVERGWLLLPDAGATLRSLIESPEDLWRWHRLLPVYAEVQIEMSARCGKLLSLGTLDRRLTTLPAQYERLLSDTAALRVDQPDGLTSDEYRRLRDLALRLPAMCGALASYGIPETLHHDDFHDANIFVRDERLVFADWAESCVSHPFFTPMVMLRSIGYRLKLDAHGPELLRLREIYLEPWTRYGSREDLLGAFELAQPLAMLCRALTWYRVVSGLDEPFKTEYAEVVPGWLQEFLNAATTAG